MHSTQSGKPRIALVNPNTSAATTARMVAIAAAAAGGEADIVGITAPSGAPLITSVDALDVARDAVLTIPYAEFERVAGVIVAAFGDPGADELARRLAVPVIGIAEASMRAAARFGCFSIVTTTPLLAMSIRERAVFLGLGDRLASVRTSDEDPATLTADEPALRAALRALIDVAVAEDGAQAVIIGGGPLASAARVLATVSPVPLIEPVPIAARTIIERLVSRYPA